MIGPISGGPLTTAVEGMERAARMLTATAERSANPERSLDNAAMDAVERSVSQTTYQANAAVVRTADELLGTVLDLTA